MIRDNRQPPRRKPAWIAFAVLLYTSTLSSAEIAIQIQEPSGVSRRNWPVSSGIPLPAGAMQDPADVQLQATDGTVLDLQTEVLARWPDKSVRWLLLDFQVNLAASEKKTLKLLYGDKVTTSPLQESVEVAQTETAVTIDTGPLKLELAADSFRLLDRVWLDLDGNGQLEPHEQVTSSDGAGIILTTPDGEQFMAHRGRARMKIEQRGPLRCCVRIEGEHRGDKGGMYRYVVRIHAFRGLPFLRLDYTFINDHAKTVMSDIDSLELAFQPIGQSRGMLEQSQSGMGRLFQVDDLSFQLNGNRAGKRARGWAALGGPHGGMAVGVRDFWQNWPKSLSTGKDGLRVGICPQFPAGLYDNQPLKQDAKLYYYLRNGAYRFKLGASRTHELWAHFYNGQADREKLSDFFTAIEKPLLAQCSPDYVSQTQAAGKILPADPQKYFGYDKWLDGFFAMHLEDQDQVREYGLLNYGDWYNVHWDSWGNLEYDTARCFFTQYLRSGDRRYFDRASAAARHFVDVDILHATNDAIKQYGGSFNAEPGAIWAHTVGHTGGYYARYVDGKYVDEAPLIMKGAYQVGMMDTGHHWIGGVYDYYLLTGDRRAREVATIASRNMAARCPTRYSDHVRGVGWPLNMMLAAYEATADEVYLEAAKKQWETLKSHLDPDRGWVVMLAYGHCSEASTQGRCRGQNSYMLALTLSGLARYHRLTRDPEVLRALTAGLDQMIRECWSESDQSFYLTSCVHQRSNPAPPFCSATFLASEAFAYEYQLTGNQEHRRIFLAAFRTAVNAAHRDLADRKQAGQSGYYSSMFHFTPFSFSIHEPGE